MRVDLAIDEGAGGTDRLREFVKACHQQGIVVILDVCYNHFDPDGDESASSYYLDYPDAALSDPYFMSPSDWETAYSIPGDCTRRLERAAAATIDLLKGELWQPLLAASRTQSSAAVQ